MKNLALSVRTRSAALLLAAVVGAPLGLVAQTTPAQPGAPVVTDVATIDLNRPDAVNLRLQTKTVTDSVESATYALRDSAIALARRGSEDGRVITSSVRAGARILGDDAREDVEKATERAEQARQRLNGAISLATDSTETRWKDLRDELSERYEQYATALEEARQEAVDGGVRFESQITPAATPANPVAEAVPQT